MKSETPKSDFGLDVFLENGKYRAHFEWDQAVYTKDTIDSFKRLYELVLNELLTKKNIKDINCLPEFDKAQYEKFNQTEVEIPKDHIDSFMNLHDSDSLNSNDLSEPYMMTYTNENDKLPKHMMKYGFDNLGFQVQNDEDQRIVGNYLTYSEEIPNNYNVTVVVIGLNIDGEITWYD